MSEEKSTAITVSEAKPKEIIQRATEQANALMDIVEKKHLYATIEGKKYLVAEAWETIGAFNNTYSATDWVNALRDDKGEIIAWEAQVSLWRHNGRVGSAIMSCGLDEFPCRGKEGEAKHKAAKSAAQTWATSKAYRMNFAFIAVLGGYEPTPAEEMPNQGHNEDGISHPWLQDCPIHKVAWRQGKYGRSHKDGDLWCNLKDILRKKKDRQKAEAGLTDEEINQELKDRFGKTWSQITEEQQIAYLKELELRYAPKEDDLPPEGE